MHILYIDKCRYEIQEQKEFPVRYTGIYRAISSTGRYQVTWLKWIEEQGTSSSDCKLFH
jgi:hypothetical protein